MTIHKTIQGAATIAVANCISTKTAQAVVRCSGLGGGFTVEPAGQADVDQVLGVVRYHPSLTPGRVRMDRTRLLSAECRMAMRATKPLLVTDWAAQAVEAAEAGEILCTAFKADFLALHGWNTRLVPGHAWTVTVRIDPKGLASWYAYNVAGDLDMGIPEPPGDMRQHLAAWAEAGGVKRTWLW